MTEATEGKINLLKPTARQVFIAFIGLLENRGLRYAVLETLRTAQIQAAYYAQGREPIDEVNRLRLIAGLQPLPACDKDGRLIGYGIITNAKVSPHQSGEAGDVVPVVDDKGTIPWAITASTAGLWKAFGMLGQEAGLKWGGLWSPFDKFGIGWDAPHYQL